MVRTVRWFGPAGAILLSLFREAAQAGTPNDSAHGRQAAGAIAAYAAACRSGGAPRTA